MDHWEFTWDSVVNNTIPLIAAYILAAPIGFNREKEAHSAGLRTFPLVAVGACAFVLVGLEVFDNQEAQSRIIYGIVTGIGFIGGGAILKQNGGVSGTATAASIWNTGAIGVAVGWGQLDIAVVLSLISVLTLAVGGAIKRKLNMKKAED